MRRKDSSHTVVVFTSNNARLLKVWGRDLEHYGKLKNAMVDPDITAVRGIPPHFWKPALVRNRVVPKSHIEKLATVASHNLKGVDNYINLRKPFWLRYYLMRWYTIVLAMGIAVWITRAYYPDYWNGAIDWLSSLGLDQYVDYARGKLVELLKGIIYWLT